jgi:hypothetical protein
LQCLRRLGGSGEHNEHPGQLWRPRLTTPAGIAALDSRIEGAVRRICGRAYPVELQAQADASRCRAEARLSVQAQRGDALASAQKSPDPARVRAAGNGRSMVSRRPAGRRLGRAPSRFLFLWQLPHSTPARAISLVAINTLRARHCALLHK